MTLDTRYDPPRLLICDRNHEPKGRLLHYDLDGNFIEEVITGLGMPTSAAVQGDYVSVPDLHGRVCDSGQEQHNHFGAGAQREPGHPRQLQRSTGEVDRRSIQWNPRFLLGQRWQPLRSGLERLRPHHETGARSAGRCGIESAPVSHELSVMLRSSTSLLKEVLFFVGAGLHKVAFRSAKRTHHSLRTDLTIHSAKGDCRQAARSWYCDVLTLASLAARRFFAVASKMIDQIEDAGEEAFPEEQHVCERCDQNLPLIAFDGRDGLLSHGLRCCADPGWWDWYACWLDVAQFW